MSCYHYEHNSHCYNCEHFFRLNLAGLTDHLNFKLIKQADRFIVVTAINGDRLFGKVDQVGIDYIDLKRENGCLDTILKEKIAKISFIN